MVMGNQYQEAIPLLSFAIENWDGPQKDLDTLIWDRGIAFNCTERHENAVSDFSAAIEISDSGFLYHARAIAHRKLNDFPSAINDFKIAHNKIPSDDWTVMFLSQLLSCAPNERDRDGIYAKKLAQLLLESTPEQYDLLSCACAELGEFEQAIDLQSEIMDFWHQDDDDELSRNGIDLATNRLAQFRKRIPIRLGINDCNTWYQSFCKSPISDDNVGQQ